MATQPDIRAFIDRQRILLSKERKAEVERTSLLLSNCGPKLLEQKGLSLGGLGIASVNIGLGGKTLVELERPTAYHSTPVFPPHTFRAGDISRIESHAASNKKSKSSVSEESKGSQVEGVVYKVSDSRIVIALDTSDSGSDELDLPERCRVVKLANSVTFDRMDNAIDQLEKIVNGQSASGLTSLIEVLLGVKQPAPKTHQVDNLSFFDDSLNDSQKTAVRFCLESPEVACIHGPPGTGKTHTLIEIIRQLTTKSDANPEAKRVLVCGASNLSVDNILERLLTLPVVDKTKRLKVTRIGHPARVMSQEGILESTLEVKATRSDEAALARDVKEELESTLGLLSGKGKATKGKKPRGAERKKLWEDVKALRKEYRQREGGVVKSILKDSQVVLSTCHSSGGRQMANQEFDVVIIDEATQAIEAVCWVPIFKAKKLILAGDPMQLPPTILSIDEKKTTPSDKTTSAAPKPTKKETGKLKKPSTSPPLVNASQSESESDRLKDLPISRISLKEAGKTLLIPPKTLETTLFDRLEDMYGSSIKRMLTVQYRMHESICTFPSKTLYASKLKSHPSVASHLLHGLPNAQASSEDDEKELLKTPVVFFDTSGCEYFERLDGDADEGSRCNENEATIVSNWVDKLLSVNILPEQIAILTPYQAQVTLLNSLLRLKHGPALEIGTVDGMQGREKEAVIISLVRSNDKREVGFLKDKRRMNVAMTRARRHLCVVGDSSTVSHGGKYLKKWLTWLEAHADIKYAGLE